MDKKNLIIGNWKLHGALEFNRHLVSELRKTLTGIAGVECVVCPPFVYLSQVNELLEGCSVLLGAQNVGADDSGAFTGEVSVSMLLEMGCRYVIIGHMERRTLYSESDELIARKFHAAQSVGLIPILCVGETLEQHNDGVEQSVVRAQLQACLNEKVAKDFVVAYEPAWAIGTGQTAKPKQIGEMHRFLSDSVKNMVSKDICPRVVYGGSVKADNATDLFAIDFVDGALVGGASLNADNFSTIARMAKA